MNMREALERIAKYPVTSGDDLSIELARKIAREALASQAQQPTVTDEMIAAAEAVEDLYRRGTPYTWKKVFLAMWREMPSLQSQAQQPAKPFIYISEDEFAWRSKSGDLNGTRSLTCITPQHFGETHYRNFTVPLYLQSQAQQESQWMPIEAAPKNTKIIVRYKNVCGKDRTVFAKYLDKFTEEATAGTDCETDYCEDDDTFYCKEGWVELIDNWDEFSSVYFDSQNVPTHWMPIPPAPEGGE